MRRWADLRCWEAQNDKTAGQVMGEDCRLGQATSAKPPFRSQNGGPSRRAGISGRQSGPPNGASPPPVESLPSPLTSSVFSEAPEGLSSCSGCRKPFAGSQCLRSYRLRPFSSLPCLSFQSYLAPITASVCVGCPVMNVSKDAHLPYSCHGVGRTQSSSGLTRPPSWPFGVYSSWQSHSGHGSFFFSSVT